MPAQGSWWGFGTAQGTRQEWAPAQGTSAPVAPPAPSVTTGPFFSSHGYWQPEV